MDEENMQNQENNAGSDSAQPEGQQNGPRVHIFGAEINGGGSGGDWSRHSAESKEEWRKRKHEWKQQHREQVQQQRDQWKAQRHEWRSEHGYGGGMFFGMILLFAGVVALLYTMGFISHAFWYAIEPFWPILLILWGASIILGRHWFARFILFLFTIAILLIIIFYGLARTDSPLVSFLSPGVVHAVQITQPAKY